MLRMNVSLDLRHLRAEVGVGVEDVAKRLVDFGFHAPTMSWPVTEDVDGGADGERVIARARPVL